MNWDAIGSIGEIVGAIAVVVSVIYLAAQVRKQTEESRLSASRELAADFGSAIDQITNNLDTSEVWLKACQSYDDLPNRERIWASFVFQRLCRVMEQQRLHLTRGNVDPVYFDSLQYAYREWLTFPGVQQWWEASKDKMFGAEFRKYVDDAIVEAKAVGYASSFKDRQ